MLVLNYLHVGLVNVMSKRVPQKPKPRFAKELFVKDSPYGHKVQRDRTKYNRNQIKREQLLNENP